MIKTERHSATVSEELVGRIQKQLVKHGIVVWFDPDESYRSVVDALLTEKRLQIEQWSGSFFDLRWRLEPYIAGETPGEVVVYVPLAREDSQDSLAELIALGRLMEPGCQPPACNTRLSVVARAALAEALPEKQLSALLNRVDAGELTLEELEQLSEQGSSIESQAISLAFESDNPILPGLALLAGRFNEEALSERISLEELIKHLAITFGLASKASVASFEELRLLFSAHLVSIEIREVLDSSTPESIPEPANCMTAKAWTHCLQVMTEWRQRRDYQTSYADVIALTEHKLELDRVVTELEHLVKLEGYRTLELALIGKVEIALLESPSEMLREICSSRQQSFWSCSSPELGQRWKLLEAVSSVLILSDMISSELKEIYDLERLVQSYLGSGPRSNEPWCLLDRNHRHMEQLYYQLDFGFGVGTDTLGKLITRARQRYSFTVDQISEIFLARLATNKFQIPGLRKQTEVFRLRVQPELAKYKTAYILVDALRFEMVEELQSTLKEGYVTNLEAVQGTLPSVTPVGMAALMPGADRESELTTAGGKVTLKLGDVVLKNRTSRLRWLEESVPQKVYCTKFEAILPPTKAEQTKISEADLVVVTATDELDGLCEKGNIAMARRLMDDVLKQIRRALGVLTKLGVERFIVTSDHGFIFGEPLDSGTKIDPPGGDTFDLHRRVWVGKGGAHSSSYLRVTAKDLGLGGDLELAFPKTTAAFKSPGRATAYFHGGATPQELLLPLWHVRPEETERTLSAHVNWKLSLGSKVLSTRFFSVVVEGDTNELVPITPPTVLVEIEQGKSSISCQAVAASYGFEASTGLVKLKALDQRGEIAPVTITLQITEEELPKKSEVSVVLRDADSNRKLASVPNIKMSIVEF